MKKDLCYRCKQNEAEKKGGDISFTYQGIQIKVFRVGGLCTGCVKAEWMESFEENAKEFINIVDGKPRVNWQHYHEHFAMGRFHDQKERFHYLLVNLGILSHRPKGNWEIVADGPIGLNPRAYLSYLYFTRKEDAIEFARLEKARTLYQWEIHHIGEVISKQNVMKTDSKSE